MTGIHKTSLVSHKFLTFWYSTVIDMKVVKIMCVCVCVCRSGIHSRNAVSVFSLDIMDIPTLPWRG